MFVDGEKFTTLRGDNIANEFKAILDDYVRKRYSQDARAASGEDASAA